MYLTPQARTRSCCATAAGTRRTSVATSRKAAAEPEELREVCRVETPHATTIEELAALLEVARARTAKIVFLAAEHRSEDGHPVLRLIVAVVRGDTDLNEAKLANLLGGPSCVP